MSVLGNERGATLMETAMAVGLLAIAALGIGHSTIGIQRATKTSHNATIAATVAADKLEELRAMDTSAVASGTDTVTVPEHPSWSFTRTWTVETNDDDGNVPLGTRRVQVIVNWSDYQDHQVFMSTLLREEPT